MCIEYSFKVIDKYSTKSPSGDIYVNIKKGEKKLLHSLTSQPEKIGNYIAYISPYDKETKKAIYLYDLKKNYKTKLYEGDELKCPFFLRWKDEATLYVLLGETYDSRALAGNLYSLNIYSKKIKLLKQFPLNMKITSFYLKENEKVLLQGMIYLDHNFIQTKPYSGLITIHK